MMVTSLVFSFDFHTVQLHWLTCLILKLSIIHLVDCQLNHEGYLWHLLWLDVFVHVMNFYNNKRITQFLLQRLLTPLGLLTDNGCHGDVKNVAFSIYYLWVDIWSSYKMQNKSHLGMKISVFTFTDGQRRDHLDNKR